MSFLLCLALYRENVFAHHCSGMGVCDHFIRGGTGSCRTDTSCALEEGLDKGERFIKKGYRTKRVGKNGCKR